jgi:hypothetical protein
MLSYDLVNVALDFELFASDAASFASVYLGYGRQVMGASIYMRENHFRSDYLKIAA